MNLFHRKQRKAKIVCTIGPSSADKEILSSLVRRGMNVARINFSHGDYNDHLKSVGLIRDISRRFAMPVAILQDLQGVKIRVGRMQYGAAELKKGRNLLLMPGEGVGNQAKIFVSYPSLLRDVRKGDRVLLDDGLIHNQRPSCS